MISSVAIWTALVLFTSSMIFAGLRDVATMTISNRLVLMLAIAYFALAPVAGFAPAEVGSSSLAAAAVLAAAVGCFSLGWIGGGDAKLAAVAVLWLGADLAVAYILYAAIVGAILALALIQYRKLPLPAALQARKWSARLHANDVGVPYGVALGLSAVLLLPASRWLALVP